MIFLLFAAWRKISTNLSPRFLFLEIDLFTTEHEGRIFSVQVAKCTKSIFIHSTKIVSSETVGMNRHRTYHKTKLTPNKVLCRRIWKMALCAPLVLPFRTGNFSVFFFFPRHWPDWIISQKWLFETFKVYVIGSCRVRGLGGGGSGPEGWGSLPRCWNDNNNTYVTPKGRPG